MTTPGPTAAHIAASVGAGRTAAAAVIDQTLDRIGRRDRALNCFTAVFEEQARTDAAALDAELAASAAPGPLAGVPFAVKNLFDVKGVTTLAGSIIEADSPPAASDAALVGRLKAAGAILVGALNMDEYAYGFTTENAHYGPTRNPHDPTRVAGGSSGGSAAAVSAGMAPITLGSDTNGSIRVPAGLCGVFGLKPTFGRLSRRGVFPFVHDLDHAGAFAGSIQDLALAYDVLQGFDPLDPASVDRPHEPATPALSESLGDLRAASLGGWFTDGAEPDVVLALGAVRAALRAAPAELTGAKAARAAAFCLTAASGGSLHLANLRARPNDFDHATRDRLIAGAMQPAAVIARAHRYRRLFLEEAMRLFEQFDILLAPATPFAAPPIGQATIELGGQTVSVRAAAGLYCQPISFIGLPVLTVPVRRPGLMPIGVQLIAPPWQEARLFQVAAWLEREGVIAAEAPPVIEGAAA